MLIAGLRAAALVAFGFLLLSSFSISAGDAGTGDSFKGPVGLQLYSLRAQFMANGAVATLDKVKALGIKNVELAGTANMPVDKFKALLDERGLAAISAHFPYARYKSDPEGVAKDAKALGLKYCGCAWIDHKGDFDEKTCREAIEVFNKAGEALAKEGIRFFYHCHGFEFQPYPAGGADSTLLDLLFTETKADKVSYEMDVFWIVFPGQNPVKLLEKYAGRWELMHLKDMKKGVVLGSLNPKTDVKNDVALGTGQINYAEILPAATKSGVKYFFIEDESPTSEEQIPVTLKFLEQVKY